MSQTRPVSSALIPLDEAARRLGISARTLRRIRQRGEIDVVKVSPGCVRIDEVVLQAYIRKNTVVQRSRRRGTKRRRRS